MKRLINDKKGLLLRDFVMMMIVFSAIMVFSTLFILDTADTYNNDAMADEWNAGGLNNTGAVLYANISSDIEEARNTTAGTEEGGKGIIGAFQSLEGVLDGVGQVLKIVFLSPVYFANAISSMLSAIGIPGTLAAFIRGLLWISIYTIIIFIIITAALKGGKV